MFFKQDDKLQKEVEIIFVRRYFVGKYVIFSYIVNDEEEGKHPQEAGIELIFCTTFIFHLFSCLLSRFDQKAIFRATQLLFSIRYMLHKNIFHHRNTKIR